MNYLRLTCARHDRLQRGQGAAGEREEHHAHGVDGVWQVLVQVAVQDVADADGRVGDELLEAVAAGARRSHQLGGVGQVVHARHHVQQRRHALRWWGRGRRVRVRGGQLRQQWLCRCAS
jgi:hypothetical protein